MTGPFELERFADAQDEGRIYETAVRELRAGAKRSHWMWFVFPQIAGLGHTSRSKAYAIRTLAEASAYLEHPVLGPRLAECAHLLLERSGPGAREIFGEIDALKLRSSMTLFARAAPENPVFGQVLAQYFDGVPDARTEAILDASRWQPR
ncbi:MAG: hypothetical protein JWN10_2868 [Solirubrobacterales bacterium]|nr:hypothetical protein [Solirubrobacterales bacterium]